MFLRIRKAGRQRNMEEEEAVESCLHKEGRRRVCLSAADVRSISCTQCEADEKEKEKASGRWQWKMRAGKQKVASADITDRRIDLGEETKKQNLVLMAMVMALVMYLKEV